ncbi:hypothetical protein H6F78_18100 [Coleofasciculus sp. FACHB-64]|uniref:hypothetical protein n=1 Tax=Cyanophyceae TaxID=3028117 RepID=UPI00168A0421|nr:MULTISPECIES: hypothetical protein [unclassified Coleofasciculus]MBD1841020.1 hypothetical protein [Coleofasciculus sp. FACHB-501]MBD1879156.1 hypothetical protein [Coleofasciculus sp. FACHB-T130]MBD2047483.1 hypothetical protein [Coleofasciculus sp. FACHB-64]
MSLTRTFDNIIQYFSGAIARIFGLSDDAYPVTGVQPFTGEPFREHRGEDW